MTGDFFASAVRSDIERFLVEDDFTRNHFYLSRLPNDTVECCLYGKSSLVLAGLPYFWEVFRFLGYQGEGEVDQLGRAFSKVKNVKEIYEYLVTEMVDKYVEQNYMWKLKMINNYRCEIIGEINSDLLYEFDKETILSQPIAKLREGFISCMPRFINLENAKITQTKNMVYGDRYDLYVVNFPRTRQHLGRLQ